MHSQLPRFLVIITIETPKVFDLFSQFFLVPLPLYCSTVSVLRAQCALLCNLPLRAHYALYTPVCLYVHGSSIWLSVPCLSLRKPRKTAPAEKLQSNICGIKYSLKQVWDQEVKVRGVRNDTISRSDTEWAMIVDITRVYAIITQKGDLIIKMFDTLSGLR